MSGPLNEYTPLFWHWRFCYNRPSPFPTVRPVGPQRAPLIPYGVSTWMDWKFQLLNKPYGGVTEGPVWDGEAVYFTHIPASRIMRYDPRTGEISQWRGNTNHTNGLAYDAQGRLFGCCSADRAIVRFDSGGKTATIANRLDGQRLNTPNDLAIDRRGRVWFTNPWNAGNIDPRDREELDHRSVLRADPQPDGAYTVARVTFDTTMPNGILVSADQRSLYVAESNSEASHLNRELRAYVRQLEERYEGPPVSPEAPAPPVPEGPMPNPEELVRDLEEFLREKREGGGGQAPLS